MTTKESAKKVNEPAEAPNPSPPLKEGEVITELPVNEVIIQHNLYPRQTPDEKLIERYADNIDQLPPIVVNQDCVLVDGYHRLSAHKMAGRTMIPVRVIQTIDDNDVLIQAAALNSSHGLQLSPDEKHHLARILSVNTEKEFIAKCLGVSARTIERWTRDERVSLEEERIESIIDLYLQSPTTQQEIANRLGLDQSTVSRGIKIMQERHLSDLHTWFTPFTSTIWPTGLYEVDPLPQTLVENLLYYYTKPFDLVFDPFAMSTHTVKACKKMLRRYYCSDSEGADIVKVWEPSDGLPLDLPTPDLAYIDFPGMGFRDPEEWDLPIGVLYCFFENLIQKKTTRFAMHLYSCRMTDGRLKDPLSELSNFLPDGYRIEGRYVIQYQTPTTLQDGNEKIQFGPRKSYRIGHSDLIVLVNDEYVK